MLIFAGGMLTLVSGRTRNDALKAFPAQKQQDWPGHLPLPLGKVARIARTIAPALPSSGWPPMPALRSPVSGFHNAPTDSGRKAGFFSACLQPQLWLFLKKSCIRSAVLAIALPCGRAILWALLATSRGLNSIRVDVLPFRRQNLRVETQLPWFTSINAGTGFDNYLFRQRWLSNFPIWPVFQRA